jgi:hypothetical protein
MKKLLYVKDSQKFWEIFNQERAIRREKLRKLSFARKVAILEKMQAEENQMKKLLEIKESEEFWRIFNQERETGRKKQRRLPFARKVAILEQMQVDYELLHKEPRT